MHPIEHLRYVARAVGADPGVVAREAADALAEVARIEPAGLVPACRRLIARHVTAGPVWWLSARMLRSDDPVAEGRRSAHELDDDPTGRHLADAIDDSATVVVVGWPDITSGALRRRGDLEVLVVDWASEGERFVRRLVERGSRASLVPEPGAGAAAMVADLVIVESFAGAPDGVLAAPGSLAVAAVAAHRQVPVWAVAGVGRILPEQMWATLVNHLDDSGVEPWDREAVVVPASLLSSVAGPDGVVDAGEALANPSCPAAPELFRMAG